MKNKVMSILLSLALIVTCVPAYSYGDAAENEDRENETMVQTEKDCSRDNAVMDESTENMTVFDNGDGMKTAVIYGGDVRFTDEAGKLTDYDPSLTESRRKGYSFENSEGDSRQYFPEKLNENTPIVMSRDGYEVSMVPESVELKSVEKDTTKVQDGYEDVRRIEDRAIYEGDGITYEYQSLSDGVKESIVLDEMPEEGIFRSVIDTGDLVPVLQDTGEVLLFDVKDEKKDVVSYMESPFMSDADEKCSTDIAVSLNELDDGRYEYVLEPDEEFLENASYPVTVDPTHTWKGDSQFTDVYVVSGTTYGSMNFYQSGTKVMPAGIPADGHTYRTYVKLIDLKATLEDRYVKSAKLTMYENGSGTSGQKINIYRVIDSWSKTTVTWNNKPRYNTTVHGTFKTSGKTNASHTVDITDLVRGFVNGTYSANYGIAIRNANTDPKFASFYGSRTGSTSYRPKLVVTYYDRPTAPSDMWISKSKDGEYVKSSYVRRGYSAYVSWRGIESAGLANVQQKVEAYDDNTPSPTSISGVNLTSYRNFSTTAEDADNVKVSYSSSLPEGKYRVRIRGKDNGGMYGTSMSRILYVDGTAPSVSITGLTFAGSDDQNAGTVNNPAGKVDVTVGFAASDTYLKETSVKVNDGEYVKASGNEYTIGRNELHEGENIITVKAEDKAGNTATDNRTMYVDSAGPEISSFEIRDGNGSIIETSPDSPTACENPVLSWQAGSDTVKAEIYLEDSLVNTKTAGASSGIYNVSSSLLSCDAANTFTLRAYDRAGNVTEENISYYFDNRYPVFDSIEISPESSITNRSKNLSPVISWDIDETCLDSLYFGVGDDMEDVTEWTEISAGQYGSYTVPFSVFTDSGKYTFWIKAVDRAGNEAVEDVTYYADTVPGSRVPVMTGASEYYGKRIIEWTIESPDMGNLRYDMYRGGIRISEDIDIISGTYVDSEVIENGGSLNYCIKVCNRTSGDEYGAPIQPCSVAIDSMTASLEKTSGSKGYLAYFEVGLPQGNLSVEKSSGNLMYSQEMFDVTDNGMSYGLSMTYQSRNGFTGMLGKGWSDSYHRELYESGDDIYFADADGSIYLFERTSDGYECEAAEDMSLEEQDGVFMIRMNDGYSYSFNENGSITREKDSNGNTISYTYDRKGRLVRITANRNRVGQRSLELEYAGSSGLLDEMTDYCDTEYSMDYSGNLMTEAEVSCGRDSVSNEFSYDGNGRMTSAADRMGNTYSISYSSGKASEITYPDNERYILTYSGSTTTVEKKNSAGDRIYTESCTYDGLGRLSSETDVSGIETEYTYSSAHPYMAERTETETQYESLEDGVLVIHDDEDAVEVTFDSDGNVVSENDEDGNVTTYQYSGDLVTREIEICGEDTVSDIEYSYDRDGNVITEVDHIAEAKTEYDYDSCGNEISCIEYVLIDGRYVESGQIATDYDDYGNETGTASESGIVITGNICTYDAMGRCISSTDENGVVTSTTYDYLGRSILQTVSADGMSGTSETCYNDNGSISGETDMSGLTTSYTYDSQNRVTRKATSGAGMDTSVETVSYGYGRYTPPGETESEICYVQTVTCGTIQNVTYTDRAGNVVKEEQNDIVTEYVYDDAGSMIVEYAPDESINLTVNDESSDEVIEVRNAETSGNTYAVTEDSMVTTEKSDAQGNLISSTEGNGDDARTTSYSYDNRDRLIKVETPAGNARNIEYEFKNGTADETVTVADSRENISVSVLDTSGLELSATDVDGDDVTEDDTIPVTDEYDESGRLVKELYADGTYVESSYDSFGNVVEKRYCIDENTVEAVADFEYDISGRLLTESMTDGNDMIYERCYSYDPAGRVLSVTDYYAGRSSRTTSYSYDSQGRLESVNYPSGSETGSLSYIYDSNGNVSEIKSGNRNLYSYQYDSAGRVASETMKTGNGSVRKEVSYDDLGRTSSIEYRKQNNTMIEGFYYEYNQNGWISERNHIIGNESEITEYEYDPDGRLTRSEKDGEEIIYSYDSAGNRLKKTEGDIETTYTYNGFNQLTDEISENTSTGENVSVVLYEYDERGNLIKETAETEGSSPDTVREYDYHVSGTLKSVSEGNTIIQGNVYDAEGIRISKSEKGNSTFYYYGDEGLIYSDGEADNTYIHGAGGTVESAYLGDGYSIFASDVQGSPWSLINGSLARNVTYEYSDFGETEVSGTTSNEICYTGEVLDITTGMYYMNARYYDPEVGRFISQDTYRGEDEDAGTWHLYSYCSNNPINFMDPSGHKRKIVGFGVQATISWGRCVSSGGVTIGFIWFNRNVQWANGKRFHMFLGATAGISGKVKKDATDLIGRVPKYILSRKGLTRLKRRYYKNHDKIKHLALSVGCFMITGNESFTKYGSSCILMDKNQLNSSDCRNYVALGFRLGS